MQTDKRKDKIFTKKTGLRISEARDVVNCLQFQGSETVIVNPFGKTFCEFKLQIHIIIPPSVSVPCFVSLSKERIEFE